MSRPAALLLFLLVAVTPVRAQSTLNEEIYLPAGESVNLPTARKQTLRFSPRYGNPGSFDLQTTSPGEQRLTYIGGLIVNVTYEIDGKTGPQVQEYEFAADNLVIWVRGMKGANLLGGVNTAPGPTGEKTRIELFLQGNVVVRNKDEVNGLRGARTVVTRTVRADQMYYDVEQSKAVATKADLELKFDNLADSVHVYGERIERRSKGEWYARGGGAFSSKLPSDPGVRLLTSESTLREYTGERTNIFGIPYRTLSGDVDNGVNRILEAKNARLTVGGVPLFYLPYYSGDISEPLGPLRGINIGNDRIFGTQLYTTWDMYKLLALRAPPGHNWTLDLDYLTNRGPAVGSSYDYRNPDFFGFGGQNFGTVRFYGINDRGTDVLGGFRGPEPDPGLSRGRGLWRHQQELFADRDLDGMLNDRYLTLTAGFAYLSDKNFLEQYFKQEFDTGPNQETFAFLQGSRGQFYGSLLAQGGLNRNWITETQWLPKVQGSVVGQSFLDDWLQYEATATAGYARLLPSTIYPPPYNPTDQRINTGRVDLIQELSVPLDAGPVRIRPYGILDGTYYSQDLAGNDVGRLLGGGGASAAMTFSRIYRDANSEIFNVRGLNHKVTPWVNYANLRSNVNYNQLPQLDRLNDDTIDQGLRTMHPYFFPLYYPNTEGFALQNAPQFQTQPYAIRRLALNRVDTRDDIEVIQTGLFQRLQTKRGPVSNEHTVDWMALGVTASFFPNPSRDNFGKSAAFLEFNYLWNVGDQTAFTASGWFDPYDPGTNYWTVGTFIQRPDGVNFFLGYRQTEPLNSKVVTLSALYQFSRKYAFNVGTSYDFGNQLALSNTFTIYRTGTDLTAGLGFTYNALVNNFGVQFVVVPNLAAAAGVGRMPAPNLAMR